MFKDSSPGRQICGSVPPPPETGSLHLSFSKHSFITSLLKAIWPIFRSLRMRGRR